MLIKKEYINKNGEHLKVVLVRLVLMFLMGSCASIPVRNPLPEELGEAARIPGMERARIWGDESPLYFEEWFAQKLEAKGTPRAYLIRNSFLDPDWETVRPKIVPIAGESINSLIRTQGIGDMYRIYLNCQRDGLDYNLAYIPGSFDKEPSETFDPVYIRELFELGYQLALEGYPWAKAPPGFE